MGIFITLFWIWLAIIAVGWVLVGCLRLCLKIGDLQDYLNAKLNKAFGLQ